MRSLPLAVLLSFTSLAACAGTLDDAKTAGVLRVGTPGDYAPFSIKAADGSYHGADIAEIERVAAHLGLKTQMVATSWSKLADDTEANRFDIAVGGISITPARQEFADFTVPLVTDGKRPIARCADAAKYTSLAAIDQPGVRVVTNPGGTNDAFAKANLSHAAITVFSDNTKIFAEIAEGREDVMVTDGVEVDHQALLHPGVLCATAVPAPFTQGQLGYLLQKDPALKQAVDDFLAGEIKSGHWHETLVAAEREP